MLELLGDTPGRRPDRRGHVMEIETALAKASLTRVEKRDPYKLFHKLTRAQLVALTPSFGWADYFSGSGLPAPASSTSPSRVSTRRSSACSRPRPVDNGRPTCAGTWCTRGRPISPRLSCRRTSISTASTCAA